MRERRPIGQYNPNFSLSLRERRSFISEKHCYEVAVFKCKNLEKALKEQLGVSILKKTDLAKITKIEALNRGITSLEGLQYCKNLQFLDLRYNNIEDISPISKLPNLSQIYLSGNRIESVAPLAEFPNKQINALFLRGNKIKDITPLSHFREIKNLCIAENQIDELLPLANAKIEQLWAAQNNLTLTDINNLFAQNRPVKTDIPEDLVLNIDEFVIAIEDIHPRYDGQVYKNLCVPRGALGYRKGGCKDLPGYSNVWFPNLYDDGWYFENKYLKPITISYEQAVNILDEYRGHHCEDGQFQYNVKMYNYVIPEEIKNKLTYEEIEDGIKLLVELSYEEFKSELACFDWVKDIWFAGRMGGWLVINTEEGTENIYGTIEALISEIEERTNEIRDIPYDIFEQDVSAYTDMEFSILDCKKDIDIYLKEFLRYVLSLEFIGQVIKHRVRIIEDTLSSLEFWEEYLSENI